MEQRDFLLREIEKIEVMLKTLLNSLLPKFLSNKDNIAITDEKQTDNAKVMLNEETGFDLDKYLHLNTADSNEYISGFKGFSVENIELLAECVFQIGLNDTSDNSGKYLEKALQLYELCNTKSKTYSLEREEKMQTIMNILQH